MCPSSCIRLSQLVVLGFLPTSCAISAQPGCSPGPAILEAPCWWTLRVRGTSCLLSLPWSSLLSEWCCPPLPHVFGVCCLSFFFFFFFWFLVFFI